MYELHQQISRADISYILEILWGNLKDWLLANESERQKMLQYILVIGNYATFRIKILGERAS